MKTDCGTVVAAADVILSSFTFPGSHERAMIVGTETSVCVPKFIMDAITEDVEDFLDKTGLAKDQIQTFRKIIYHPLIQISESALRSYWLDAIELTRDPDRAITGYVAAALATDSKYIWSNTMKQTWVGEPKILNTAELESILY